MRGFIYTGGNILAENITEHPRKEDLCIAADSGYINARALGERIDILVGDLDSIGSVSVPDSIERVTLPAEKDDTDTQAAVGIALERGCDEIIIVGGVGTRLDHSMSNLGILEALRENRICGYITNGYNRIHYIENDSILIAKSDYKYLSVIAADKTCRDVSIDGCKYSMKKKRLLRGMQFAVSNEICGNVALVSVRRGALYIIESRD